jgi:hypothetical protein
LVRPSDIISSTAAASYLALRKSARHAQQLIHPSCLQRLTR